eukprot:12131612-Ditylum_brightwellii.AAC.1
MSDAVSKDLEDWDGIRENVQARPHHCAPLFVHTGSKVALHVVCWMHELPKFLLWEARVEKGKDRRRSQQACSGLRDVHQPHEKYCCCAKFADGACCSPSVGNKAVQYIDDVVEWLCQGGPDCQLHDMGRELKVCRGDVSL